MNTSFDKVRDYYRSFDEGSRLDTPAKNMLTLSISIMKDKI